MYDINDIETLSFKDGVRKRIAMYLGSADMQGVYNGIQEIISNSIDEYYMGYGNKIVIDFLGKSTICISDYGRGVPFGIKEDGSNVLVDIFSKPHTGGKFNNKVYNSVGGLNGIGAKATCLSSDYFTVTSYRGKKSAQADFSKGVLRKYTEIELENEVYGTCIEFSPDEEVFNLEPIEISFEKICERCKNLSYLTKGLTFEINFRDKKVIYCAKNGLLDLIKDSAKNPINKIPCYYSLKEEDCEIEVAFQWTTGSEKTFTFTNGIENTEGGTSLTGVKTAITNYLKKSFKDNFNGEIVRNGLVYAVSCKIPNPSFANQTKTKINNPELRGLAHKATTSALSIFEEKFPKDFAKIIEFVNKENRISIAAQKARAKIMNTSKEIDHTQSLKAFSTDKLKDAEFLGQNSILLVVEGDSAIGGLTQARDYKKYGVLGLRGKILNCLKSEEKIYDNDVIKLLLKASGINPLKYDGNKLRYGKIAICTDADSDGSHICLLIIAAILKLAPDFIREGRLFWLRTPLYIVKSNNKNYYFYNDEELNNSLIKGVIKRAKGLGALEAEEASESMFNEKEQRLDQIILTKEEEQLIEDLMGKDSQKRKDFIFNNIDFSEIKE